MEKWTIIYNGGKKLKGFSITYGAVASLLIFLGLFTGIFTYTVIQGTRKKALAKKYERLKRENSKYLEDLNRLYADIKDLNGRFGIISENNQYLAHASKIDIVNKSVKEMGTGGFPESKEFYSNKLDSSVRAIEREISKSKNLIELENSSFSESNKKLSTIQDRLSHTPSTWPSHGWVTDGYGWRLHPITGKREFHKGYDIANLHGTRIYATADGKVVSTKWRAGYGRTIIIDHGYGFKTRYAHLRSIFVRVGQEIKRGDCIASMGSTGLTTGPHLHYEVRVLGRTVNPSDYLDRQKYTY